MSVDEINNIISFKCPSHGTKSITIKDYLKDMKKNTYLNNICNTCQKQYYLNIKEAFNYCTNCKIILCGKCIQNHDKNHIIIKSNKITTKCSLHPKNNNVVYCLDCNCHLCKECSKHRKHMRHNKQNIEDIEPSYEEINYLLKIINPIILYIRIKKKRLTQIK